MPSRVPQPGDREDARTEFKGTDTLRTREGRRKLLRGIVAFRNHRGGTVWVGVRETGGSVSGLEPLGPADEPHVSALRDLILDSVEPRLHMDDDLRIEPRDVDGGWILEIHVRPRTDPRVPAHIHSGAGREFLIREGARIMPMATEQIFGAAKESNVDLRVRAEQAHGKWLKKFQAMGGLALTVLPAEEDDGPGEPPQSWTELVRNPPAHIARPQGWTWQSQESREARARRGVLESGYSDERRAYRRLEVHPSGRLHFFTDLESLVWQPAATPEQLSKLFPDFAGEVHPYCLVESVASTLRLSAALLRHVEVGEIAAVLSLEHARGWVLAGGAPNTFWHGVTEKSRWVHFAEDTVRTRVVVRPRQDLLDRGDAAGYALLKDLYESGDTDLRVESATIPWFTADLRFVPAR